MCEEHKIIFLCPLTIVLLKFINTANSKKCTIYQGDSCVGSVGLPRPLDAGK